MKIDKRLRLIALLREILHERFNLEEDKATEEEIIDNVKKGIEFKGMNLWVLIFAIFIASVGLNVNSTAVIIGAMLISPLMGPIMGIGLGIGINDFELIKKSYKNLGVAVLISVVTSTAYFLITPLSGTIRITRTHYPNNLGCNNCFVWWFSRNSSGNKKKHKQCHTRCSDCYSFNASSLYRWFWLSNRKSFLFLWCVLFIFYQQCVY